ncbi:MAG: D-alanyl-D-alanine carboxypeptidase [Spirochaetales bacterium]|nr:D-alanyl-D-alanine carboxypeptidase [Spirochaetales bacterium]
MKRILSIAIFLSSLLILSAYSINNPLIIGKTALTIDVDTGEIIFAKDMDRRMYPASTTKLVTALLLAKSASGDDILTYSAKAKESYPYRLDPPVGTEIKASDAMDVLLLFSANDIAYMIGEHLAGSIDRFADQMNEYVNSLGLLHTHFSNPSGLHSPDHYSTAYDLSVLARKVYSYPWIMETIGKKESVIRLNNIPRTVRNRNKMLLQKGCIGGKTGWTPEAGRCLVALFQREKRNIVGIVLASEYGPDDTAVFADMETIIDYSYEAKKEIIIKAPSIVKTIPISFKLVPLAGPVITRLLSLQIKEPITAYPKGDPIQISFTVFPINILQIDKKKPQGIITIKQREHSETYNLYPTISSNDILRLDILPFYTAVIAISFILILIIIMTTMLIRKK